MRGSFSFSLLSANGDTCMHLASEGGHLELVEFLMRVPELRYQIDAPDDVSSPHPHPHGGTVLL